VFFSLTRGLSIVTVYIVLLWPSLAVASSELHSLDDLLRLATEHNSSIKAAEAQQQARQARSRYTGAWKDPRFSVDFLNVPIQDPSFDRTPMSGIQYGIKQQVPFPGKKSSARKQQQLLAKASAANLEHTILEVGWKIKRAYYSWFEAKSTLQVLQQNLGIADQLVRIAQQRFAANLTPQQDVLKAQIEYNKIRKKLLTVEQRIAALKAQLRLLVGIDVGGSIKIADNLEISATDFASSKLIEQMRSDQPSLKVVQKRVEAAKARLRWAKKQYFPDLDVSFAYRQRRFLATDPIQGEDFFSVGISVPLPIFAASKQRQVAVEADAKIRQHQAMVADLQYRLQSELDETLAKLKELEGKYQIIRQALLPQAKAAFKNSQAAYQSGQIEFINVLTNQLALLQFQIDLSKIIASHFQEMARLDFLLGKPLVG
jgi:outer membrane protein TolC